MKMLEEERFVGKIKFNIYITSVLRDAADIDATEATCRLLVSSVMSSSADRSAKREAAIKSVFILGKSLNSFDHLGALPMRWG